MTPPKGAKTKAVASALATCFESAGYSPADLLQGPINVTDLIWEVPPIKCQDPLLGVPLMLYLDQPMAVDGEALYRFYERGLYCLRHSPQEFSDEDGHKGLAALMPKVKSGERKLALPLPAGWPAGDHLTGPVFALEVARLFRTSVAECQGFVDDNDNYGAETPWGFVGIIAGRPSLHADEWDADCTGAVQGMLETPRGVSHANCHYDLIARLRSALHEEPGRFPEFMGMDYALQALRVLADGELCKDLQQAIERMSLVAFKRKARANAFAEALGVMESWTFTDRAKVSMILEILVPAHYNLEVFARKILDPRKILPAVLSRRTEAKIIATLKHELEKTRANLQATVGSV